MSDCCDQCARLGDMPSQLVQIPDGPNGIAVTLGVMRDMVRAFRTNVAVRTTAAQVVQGCPQKSAWCEVRALHAFVRDQVRYLMDVNEVETLQTPDVTLALMVGDCDDKTTLICAMLESIGYQTRLIAIGFRPGMFEHVYPEVKIGQQWVSLETTEPVEVGWQPDPRQVLARLVRHNHN